MATVGRPIAICVSRWLYSLSSEILQLLKAAVLWLIEQIDIEIARLRAILAQYDIVANVHEILWALAQAIIDEARSRMSNLVPDEPEYCPEVYEYFSDPFVILFEQSLGNLTLFKEKYADYVTYIDNVDRTIAYWEQIKADLLLVLEVIDDAHYAALARSAQAVP